MTKARIAVARSLVDLPEAGRGHPEVDTVVWRIETDITDADSEIQFILDRDRFMARFELLLRN